MTTPAVTKYIRKRYTDSKKSAKRRDIEFYISYEEYESLFLSTIYCPVTGVLLNKETVKLPNGQAHPHTASFDRIDNRKGYVSGNLRVVSLMFNQIKSDKTDIELAKTIMSSVEWAKELLENGNR